MRRRAVTAAAHPPPRGYDRDAIGGRFSLTATLTGARGGPASPVVANLPALSKLVWLFDLLADPRRALKNSLPRVRPDAEHLRRYGEAALEQGTLTVANPEKGARNATLFRGAVSLAELLAPRCSLKRGSGARSLGPREAEAADQGTDDDLRGGYAASRPRRLANDERALLEAIAPEAASAARDVRPGAEPRLAAGRTRWGQPSLACDHTSL